MSKTRKKRINECDRQIINIGNTTSILKIIKRDGTFKQVMLDRNIMDYFISNKLTIFDNSHNYPATIIDKKVKIVSRVIWELINGPIPKDYTIDHINLNTWDNRICNLRLLTFQDNLKHRGRYNTDRYGKRTSSFLGTYKNNANNNWSCKICVNGKHMYRYGYKSELVAAYARDLLALKYLGPELAVLNLSKENYPEYFKKE